MSFQDDIKGKNTQLFPVVEIDGIWYSTNNVTIDGNYCKPILMNIPSIKESVDIESRKFKISNVSLQFNNFPFDGVRFSDQLSASSLINTEATIYFKSPSTNTVAEMEEVYKGIIRRISHDDTSVKVELEDLTEKNAHKDLPSEVLGSGLNVPNKYKNKPKPMVYGEVDLSPSVLSYGSADDGASGTILHLDYKPILGLSTEIDTTYNEVEIMSGLEGSPLIVGIDDIYSSILKETKRTVDLIEFGIDIIFNTGVKQWEYVDKSNQVTILPTLLYNQNALQVYSGYSSQSISLYKFDGAYSHDQLPPDWQSQISSENELIDTGSAIDGDINSAMSLDITVQSSANSYQAFLVQHTECFIIQIDTTIPFDTVENDIDVQTFINGISLPFVFGQDNTKEVFVFMNPDEDSVEYYFNGSRLVQKNNNVLYNGASFDLSDLLNTFDNVSGNQFGFHPTWDFESNLGSLEHIRIHSEENTIYIIAYANFYGESLGNDTNFDNPVNIDGNIYESQHCSIIEPKKIFNKDFYANVKGRVNTFNNHHELDQDEFFENPIDIIYDLVRSELGHDSIDEAEYEEAKAQHKLSNGSDWKFGFTVNKKINSKKLIEEIAKSTKCFPKFKNDGTFGFNTIKDNYDVANDYAGATPIKESEVISYSFKKTKPEQIYKKVDVQYKKDYAQDSFLKRTDPIYTGTNTGGFDENNEPIWTADYYGIGNSKEAYLGFESPYIRHDETADALAKFLSEQYRNDHLLFNLKLPLQYINLEIGDLVKFEDLFQGLKAYGIDYRVTQEINTEDSQQTYFPLFMVTSTKKNLDSVQIECMQLHFLNTGANYVSIGWNDVNAMFPDDEGNVVIIDDSDDFIEFDGDDIEISGNIVYIGMNQVKVGIVDSYDYSDILGAANVFTIQGLGFEPVPAFGASNIVSMLHTYYSDSVYPNQFRLSPSQELDHNGDGVADDLNLGYPADFGVELGEQVTFTLSSYTIPEPSESTPIGDVNNDGVVNILDIVQIVNYILGNLEFTEEQRFEGDVSGDGGINILDIVQIVNRILQG